MKERWAQWRRRLFGQWFDEPQTILEKRTLNLNFLLLLNRLKLVFFRSNDSKYFFKNGLAFNYLLYHCSSEQSNKVVYGKGVGDKNCGRIGQTRPSLSFAAKLNHFVFRKWFLIYIYKNASAYRQDFIEHQATDIWWRSI